MVVPYLASCRLHAFGIQPYRYLAAGLASNAALEHQRNVLLAFFGRDHSLVILLADDLVSPLDTPRADPTSGLDAVVRYFHLFSQIHDVLMRHFPQNQR